MKPALSELFTTAHIGRLLGITRSGAHLLTKRADFPSPIGRLGHYVLWWRADVELWIKQRDSRPQRWSVGSLRELRPELLRRPSLENVLTMTDVAALLGYSRTGDRVADALAAGELPDFPLPIGRLGNYHLWWRPDVDEWLSQRQVVAA